MKRNSKFYEDKKRKKAIRDVNEMSNKRYDRKKKKKTFLGWKRRKKINSEGKKQGIGQDLESLVNKTFVWQTSDDKKKWYPENEWFRVIKQEEYQQLPSSEQCLLLRDVQPRYEPGCRWPDDPVYGWSLNPTYEKYLCIKYKDNIKRRTGFYNRWEPKSSDEKKLGDKLNNEGAWRKEYGHKYVGWDEVGRVEKTAKNERILEKELNRELDLE